jgi:hypothetical protein
MKKLLFLFFNCLLTLTVYSQDEEHSIILKLKKSNNLKTKNVDLSSEFNKINKNITPSFRELKIDPNNKF